MTETALVVPDLAADETIANGNRAAELASRFVVDSEMTAAGAIELVVTLEDAEKRIKKQRDHILEPLKEAMERVKATAAEPMERLSLLAKTLRGRVKDWQAEQDRLARVAREAEAARQREAEAAAEKERQRLETLRIEQEAAAAKERELAAEEGREPVLPEPALPAAPVAIAPVVRVHVPEAPRVFESGRGQAVVKKRWTYEITDPNLVPREYCDPAPSKLRAAVSSFGVREIPGVRIFEETDLSISKRR